MKRSAGKAIYLSIVILLIAVSAVIPAPVYAMQLSPPVAAGQVHVLVDGIPVKFSYQPQIIDGVPMVPVLPVFEVLEVRTRWDAASGQIVAVTKDGRELRFAVGSDRILLDGAARILQSKPVSRSGNVLVPLRILAHAARADVIWASSANAVIINTPEYVERSLAIHAGVDIRLPDRQQTPSERQEWIRAFRASGEAHQYEMDIIRIINHIRVEAELEPLSIDPLLMKVARFKSQSMSDLDYYSHTGVYGKAGELAASFGFEGAVGENLYKGPTSPNWAVTGWMLSKGHRDLIMRPSFDTAGVGLHVSGDGVFYWTLMLSGETYK